MRTAEPALAREYQQRFRQLKNQEQATDHASTLRNFALVSADKGYWPKAISQFQQALDVCGECPAQGQIHKNFGLIYERAGDSKNAITQLRLAGKLLPNDPEISQALDVIRKSTDGSN